MKSSIALFLATLILGSSLLPGFSLDQSARWAEVLQHYEQHQAETPGIGFIEFLALHYGVDSPHQKHPHHSHQNLPLAGHVVPVFPPGSLGLAGPVLVQVVRPAEALFPRYADLYSFLAEFALINPPRR